MRLLEKRFLDSTNYLMLIVSYVVSRFSSLILPFWLCPFEIVTKILFIYIVVTDDYPN